MSCPGPCRAAVTTMGNPAEHETFHNGLLLAYWSELPAFSLGYIYGAPNTPYILINILYHILRLIGRTRHRLTFIHVRYVMLLARREKESQQRKSNVRPLQVARHDTKYLTIPRRPTGYGLSTEEYRFDPQAEHHERTCLRLLLCPSVEAAKALFAAYDVIKTSHDVRILLDNRVP